MLSRAVLTYAKGKGSNGMPKTITVGQRIWDFFNDFLVPNMRFVDMTETDAPRGLKFKASTMYLDPTLDPADYRFDDGPTNRL